MRILLVTARPDTAETLTSRGVGLVFRVVGYRGRLLLALLSPFFCIYCPKNEEYCLDIASLECLRHKYISPYAERVEDTCPDDLVD